MMGELPDLLRIPLVPYLEMQHGPTPNLRHGEASPSDRGRPHRAWRGRKPLSVLVVTQGVGRGRLLNALIDHTDPDRVRYSVITMLSGEGPLLGDMAARGVEVRSLGMSDGSLESVPLALMRLRRMLATARPDVVHSMLFYPSLTAELARAVWPGAPPSLVVRHHNALHHLYGRRLHARLDRWTACRATRVVAVSHAVARTLSDAEMVPAEHVTVIHNGLDWDGSVKVDSAAVAEWRRRFDTRRLLVAAGRITGEKDYPTLLRALVPVVRTYPDTLLVIAGNGPREERVRLEQLVRSLGLDRSVEFVGWIPDVYNLMAAADVFVQSSLDEAFSQTVVEARGLGVPLATTTAGAVREVVGEGHETIPAGDHDHLARRIVSLLARPEMAREAASAGIRGAREQFSAGAMAEAYVALYHRLADSAERRPAPRRPGRSGPRAAAAIIRAHDA